MPDIVFLRGKSEIDFSRTSSCETSSNFHTGIILQFCPSYYFQFSKVHLWFCFLFYSKSLLHGAFVQSQSLLFKRGGTPEQTIWLIESLI